MGHLNTYIYISTDNINYFNLNNQNININYQFYYFFNSVILLLTIILLINNNNIY